MCSDVLKKIKFLVDNTDSCGEWFLNVSPWLVSNICDVLDFDVMGVPIVLLDNYSTRQKIKGVLICKNGIAIFDPENKGLSHFTWEQFFMIEENAKPSKFEIFLSENIRIPVVRFGVSSKSLLSQIRKIGRLLISNQDDFEGFLKFKLEIDDIVKSRKEELEREPKSVSSFDSEKFDIWMKKFKNWQYVWIYKYTKIPFYKPDDSPELLCSDDDVKSFKKFMFYSFVVALSICMLTIYDRYLDDQKYGQLNASAVCRAGISVIMNQPYNIVKLDHVSSGVHFIYYIRPIDLSTWKYRCKIEEDKIIWASNWEGTPDSGRWRTSQYDEIVKFNVQENKLTITEIYTDGSKHIEDFTF